MTVHLHHGDLPGGLDLGPLVAIDTETLGLKPQRDRLCLIQLSAGDGDAHLVKIFDAAEELVQEVGPRIQSEARGEGPSGDGGGS
jgi:ribonuclease D